MDGTGDDGIFADFEEATRAFPGTPIGDESLGTPMLYSSGTTGRPKGILRPLEDIPPGDQLPVFSFLSRLWKYRDGLTYLSPAPLYHSAPQAAVNLAIRHGGTVVIMEKFDPEQYLRLVERYRVTHSQLVPTMFSRMLKLPGQVRSRYDLSSLETAVHAAAPCPVPVKQQMIEWWGPVLLEYYASTEAVGFSACDSAEWLAHPGTVGKVVLGELHILDESFKPVQPGTPGTLWFKPGSPFRYFDDVEKTAESTSPDGSMVTVGDVGYLDDDGYLYLTDRATFMIISGGVNIYPQECENLLITHPKVADAAVFGVPNEDLGEEVKAVVQLMPGFDPGPGHRRRADRLLPRAPRPSQMPPVGRLHRPAPPAPDRQALQKGPPRQLLGPLPQPYRVTHGLRDRHVRAGPRVLPADATRSQHRDRLVSYRMAASVPAS